MKIIHIWMKVENSFTLLTTESSDTTNETT